MKLVDQPHNYSGYSPIMTVVDKVIPWIENNYTNAHALWNSLCSKGILKDEIIILRGIDKINGTGIPYSYSDSTGQIYICETYLNYLWLVSYSILINWKELIHKPTEDGTYGKSIFLQKPEIVPIMQFGLNHFQLAMSFVSKGLNWPEEFYSSPTQSCFDDKNNYFLQCNALFLSALTFVIFHEVAHIKYDHFRKRYNALSKKKYFILKNLENNADNFSIKICDVNDTNNYMYSTKAIGALIATIADIFLDEDPYRVQHEFADKRIFDKTQIVVDDHYSEIYSISCIAIRFWDIYYNIGLDWDKLPNGNYYELLEYLISQKKYG